MAKEYRLNYTASDIDAKLSVIDGTKTYYTSEEVDERIRTSIPEVPELPKIDETPIEDSENLITSGGVYEALQNAGDGANDWNDIQNKPENLSDFNNDLGFQTETQVSSAINSKASEIEAKIPIIPTNVSAFTNDAGYLTEHQNLDAYALKTEIPTIPTNVSTFVNDAGYLTEHQNLDAYALKADLNNKQDKLSSYVSKVNGKTGDVNLTYSDVNALPDTTIIPTVPTNVSAFANDAGYLTEHQSLANYALKTEIPTVPSNVSTFNNDANYQTDIDVSNAIDNAIGNIDTAIAQLEAMIGGASS